MIPTRQPINDAGPEPLMTARRVAAACRAKRAAKR
jgi:hypothetical protein